MKTIRLALLAGCLGLIAACGGQEPETPVAAPDQDWPYHGGDLLEQRFSPLTEINTETVGQLGLAWTAEFEVDRGLEATPLEIDGVVYVTTAWSWVYALDAETGEELWHYDPQVPQSVLVHACCGPVNRGVAVQDGHVFVATLDGRLLALSAATGEPVWTVDTFADANPDYQYTITGAPRLAKNKVIIGNGGAEMGARGFVTAYDTKTGDLAWRFYLTPNPQGVPDGAASDAVYADFAGETWGDGAWKQTGGGATAWDSMTYDPDTDLFYIGAGNGGPFDWYVRSGGEGDNLFVGSIVAVDPDTGEYAWHYQATPEDSWDFTSTQQMIGAELEIDGETRDVLMQAPKNGFFYVLDRATGELLSAEPFSEVTWANGVDMETGRPNFIDNVHYQDGLLTIKPGPFGAHSWQAMSYSPQTGLVYIPVQITAGAFSKAGDDYEFRPIGQNVAVSMPDMPTDEATLEIIRESMGAELLAWDPVAQEARWKVDYPWYWNGGTLATAGNLVFQGTADGEFIAYNAETGEKLWSYQANTGIIAPPISYEVDGEQYVSIPVGYGGAGALVGVVAPDHQRQRGRLLTFKIGGTAELPAAFEPTLGPIDVAGITSIGDVDLGRMEYGRTCSGCHGANASVSYIADLRRSQALKDSELWNLIVLDGVLSDRGMVSFAPVLTPEESENIRAYVLQRARESTAPDAP